MTDTPFKNLKPLWLGTEYKPHCLTRSFNDDGWLGHYISPESLADMLSSATYEEFYLALELKAHDIIPTGVRGDFMAFTAPNGESKPMPGYETVILAMLTFSRRPNLLSPPRTA